ncbi:MAG TPA: mycothiol conjugate amidase Mca [Jatrophihabitantaceae bacterium]|jgi:mycothiol S-conjugate amidase|nr:mycothiol conjugate amidase Mca [Jatrophihabitantaceae bacterium]
MSDTARSQSRSAGTASGRGLRLMAVHAHPDDESSKGAATMARYVDEGVDVLVVTCTGGERGSILNPALQGRPEIEANIAQIRKAEMDRAREILGVRQEWLGFVDSGLPEGDPLPPLPEGCFGLADLDDATERLVRCIRAFRPHVITTYNEQGGYPHPDHIMCHKVSVAAFDAAADSAAFLDAGDPWQPLKLYYDIGFSKQRFAALHTAIIERGLESPFEELRKRWQERADTQEREPNMTTRVVCADWFDRRDAALLAHATQVDPGGWFFQTPMAIQREAWPTEDFELARSLIESELPEDDLFAGLRDKVTA